MIKARLTNYVLLFLLLAIILPTQAQSAPISISIALPPFYEDTLKGAIDSFMEANPDILVEIITGESPSYSPGDDIDAYLAEMTEYVRLADVLTGQSEFNPVSSRAGFYLDLTPLVNADASLNIDEFFPPMWQSYQWDGGIWAFPLAGDVIGLAYDANAFDAAGLPYPNEDWTINDLILSAEELAVYGEGDTIEVAPITNFADLGLLAVTALDAPLYDPLQFESLPDFNNPQMEMILQEWLDIQEDGFLATPEGFELTPIVIAPSVLVAVAGLVDAESETNFQFTTLPEGKLALQAVGAAISAGSSNPEAAYRLIKFLSEDPEAFTAMVGNPIPARRSLFGTESNNPLLSIAIPEFLQETIFEYAEIATPYSETLFSNYISAAVNNLASDSELEVATALDDMSLQAINDLEAATAYRETLDISVNSSNEATAGIGTIELKFGIVGFGRISNEEGWDAAISEFISNNPELASIELERLSFLTGDVSLSDFHEKVDCFYQPSRLSSNEDLSLLLPLDPLLATDPNINRDDFVGNSLAMLSQNNLVYGLPLHIQPEVLMYNPETFNAAGAELPYQGWTVDDFEFALRSLRPDESSEAVFQSQTGGNYILSLTAAYGGLLIDYRSQPPTIDYLSETNVNALREVLDLAKDGYIHYIPLTATGLGALNPDTLENPAMYTQIVSDLFGGGFDQEEESAYLPVTFPQGNDYTVISYDIGGAYITAATQYADTCYDFIVALSSEGTLFTGMPARRSVLNSSEVEVAQGEAAVEFYNALDEQLQQPNVIEFPSQTTTDFSQIGDLLSILWLYRAMDNYVLEDADLQTELSQAQQFTLDYQVCAAEIPAFTELEDRDIQAYVTLFAQCAVDVDESMRSLFIGVDLE